MSFPSVKYRSLVRSTLHTHRFYCISVPLFCHKYIFTVTIPFLPAPGPVFVSEEPLVYSLVAKGAALHSCAPRLMISLFEAPVRNHKQRIRCPCQSWCRAAEPAPRPTNSRSKRHISIFYGDCRVRSVGNAGPRRSRLGSSGASRTRYSMAGLLICARTILERKSQKSS